MSRIFETALRRIESRKPDRYELFYARGASTSIEARDGKIDSLTRSEDVGLSVRILSKGRIGFSYTTSLDEEAVARMVETAAEIAEVMPEDPYSRLPAFARGGYPQLGCFDARGLEVPDDVKIQTALRLEAECRAADPRVTGVRSARFREATSEVRLLDSDGTALQFERTVFSVSLLCKAEQDGQAETGHDFDFSNFLDRLDPSTVARRAATRATELLGAGAAPTMSCPAVLRNSVVADLLSFLSPSFSAEEIHKGRSMIAGREGQRILSDKLTLVDDALRPGGAASTPFDGEGTPTGRLTLVDRGVFRSALYDSKHAAMKGVKSTGHAMRGLTSPPSISTTNLYLEPGTSAPEALVEGVSRGVLITQLMGLHTANPVTGDFSLGASGILIENGALARPVRGFAVSGNLLELLGQVSDVGSDLRFFGGIGAPSVRVERLSVGGT